jgi:hypothetical protein
MSAYYYSAPQQQASWSVTSPNSLSQAKVITWLQHQHSCEQDVTQNCAVLLQGKANSSLDKWRRHIHGTSICGLGIGVDVGNSLNTLSRYFHPLTNECFESLESIGFPHGLEQG